MYERPLKSFAQLDREEQRIVREIIAQQPMLSPLSGEAKEEAIAQLISYVDNGHAKITITKVRGRDVFILQIHPQVVEAIRNQLGLHDQEIPTEG